MAMSHVWERLPHPPTCPLPKGSPDGCSLLRMEPGRLVIPELGAEWARAEGCGVWQAGSHCVQGRAGGLGPRWPGPRTTTLPSTPFPASRNCFLICEMGMMLIPRFRQC